MLEMGHRYFAGTMRTEPDHTGEAPLRVRDEKEYNSPRVSDRG